MIARFGNKVLCGHMGESGMPSVDPSGEKPCTPGYSTSGKRTRVIQHIVASINVNDIHKLVPNSYFTSHFFFFSTGLLSKNRISPDMN